MTCCPTYAQTCVTPEIRPGLIGTDAETDNDLDALFPHNATDCTLIVPEVKPVGYETSNDVVPCPDTIVMLAGTIQL